MTDASEPNLAVFCDYENVALGAEDASFGAFDIDLVIERLLEKGKGKQGKGGYSSTS